MFEVRATTIADCDAVSRVLGAAYSGLLAGDYPAETLAAIVPLISRAKPGLLVSGTYHAVLLGGVIIGVGGWTRERPGTTDRERAVGHIRHVATDPAHLRKGAARALMLHILDQAQAEGIERMECLSTRTAVTFYASCGFVPFAERDVMIGGHAFPSVDMRLNFTLAG
jgi:GNAT superfamily N-acetyltransferase